MLSRARTDPGRRRLLHFVFLGLEKESLVNCQLPYFLRMIMKYHEFYTWLWWSYELKNIESYKLNLTSSGKRLGGREGYFRKSHSLSFAPQSIGQAIETLKSTSCLPSWEKSYCVLAAQHFKWRVPHVAFAAISQDGNKIHSTKGKTPQPSKICQPFSTSWRSRKSTQAISSSKNLLVDASAVARSSWVFKRGHW